MTASTSDGLRKDYVLSITIIGVLFFIFGFVTWLNSTLIPFLKLSCDLNNVQAYLVTFAFYISYFVMALPSSWVLKKTGFKSGMALGLLVMAMGTLFFLPAAMNRMYSLFLLGLFIQGTGLSILQTASNPYVTILGPIESGAKRISIMGICNKVAGVISPLVLGAILLKNADALKLQVEQTTDMVAKAALLDDMAAKVIMPYIIMTIALIVLAIMIRLSPLPEIEGSNDDKNTSNEKVKTSIFKYPYLVFGFFAIFLYVGAEVIAGDTIILYGQAQGFPLFEAKVFTSYTLMAMVVGYILGIVLIPKVLKQENALAIASVLGIGFSILAIFSSGFISVLFIAILGLANAVMWPAIWPLAIERLGKYTKTGSAILIMGIAGGALLPLLYGRLADIESIGNQQAYWILLPCYVFILFFAVSGHKIGKKKTNIS